MKKVFIRGLWGIYDNSHRIIKRRYQIDKNIDQVLNSKYQIEFKTYIMGIENYKRCKSLGIDCTLLCEEPFKFDIVKYQYRNKLEIIKQAIEKDNISELVYLDWDCLLKKDLSENFWELLREKQSFQANLQMYHRRKAYWRKDDKRKIPNGGFVYLGNADLINKAIYYWEANKQDNDEPAWARVSEDLSGGWKGLNHYWENFEPMCVNLHKASPFEKELLNSKYINFIHYQG